MSRKKVVDAKADSDGDITAVRFQGNTGFTPLKTAIKMVERGDVEGVHVVHPKGREPYLRSNPDSKKGNNLDDMAGDK